MADSEFTERMKQRQKKLGWTGGGILFLVLVLLLVRTAYYDTCTKSFERSQASVIQSYVHAIQGNDIQTVRNCWVTDDFYSLDTGCSEICLSRVAGISIQKMEIQAGAVETDSTGRNQVRVAVNGVCPDGKTAVQAEILLDTANQNLPWAHWKIINSTYGGTFAEPWCQ